MNAPGLGSCRIWTRRNWRPFPPARGGLHVRALRRRRPQPPGLLRGAPRRENPHRRRVHHPGVAVLPAIRHPPHRGSNDRQPPGLHPQPRVQSPPPASGDQAPDHQTPQPPTERQKRNVTAKPSNPNGPTSEPGSTKKPEPGALLDWLYYYHNHRPGTSLGGKPPITRL